MKIISTSLFICFLTLGCVSGQKAVSSDTFPDAWWAPVPPDQVAGWEVPPQAADRSKGEVVLSKRNELGQFSNLQKGEFYLDNQLYGSVEGLWQGMKYPETKDDERLKDPSVVWPYTRQQVYMMSGFEAKKAGDLANANMKKLGIKWLTYKGEKIEYVGKDYEKHYEIILRASHAKLDADCHLTALLKSTGKLKFMADHKQSPDSRPAYKYHEIYQKIRDEWVPQYNTPKDVGFNSCTEPTKK